MCPRRWVWVDATAVMGACLGPLARAPAAASIQLAPAALRPHAGAAPPRLNPPPPPPPTPPHTPPHTPTHTPPPRPRVAGRARRAVWRRRPQPAGGRRRPQSARLCGAAVRPARPGSLRCRVFSGQRRGVRFQSLGSLCRGERRRCRRRSSSKGAPPPGPLHARAARCNATLAQAVPRGRRAPHHLCGRPMSRGAPASIITAPSARAVSLCLPVSRLLTCFPLPHLLPLPRPSLPPCPRAAAHASSAAAQAQQARQAGKADCPAAVGSSRQAGGCQA